MYWWEYLGTLREEVPTPAELIDLLTAASKAVAQDSVWESSGIERLLERARQKASVCADSARTEALALLSFHQQRNILLCGMSGATTTSSGSGDMQELGKLSSGSASPSSDEDAAQPDAAVSLDTPDPSPIGHTLKRQRAEAGSSSATSVDHSFSAPSSHKRPRQEQQQQQQGEEGFAVPRVLPRRRVVGASGLSQTTYNLPHLGGSGASKQGASAVVQPCTQQLWLGSMHLHLEDYSSSELCHAQVQLPPGVSRHVLPQRLVFTHIVQRRGVTLGKHQVCRTHVTRANAEQAQSLRSMAVNELVAVSSQGSTAFILVPYLDSKQGVKLAGFLLQF
uniref:Uncharacterized protein n=1 Tax=Dunaliella tertiolecta TaxID=3047 RepID=A0A7S3VHU0_DUNTE|mmetsp:Transcript_6799/g.18258  ORF Transcript_6799/g.18258 Transcript_6799/m.18258 type:complete len:336 (-) Transcript_6799:1079-2086(-)